MFCDNFDVKTFFYLIILKLTPDYLLRISKLYINKCKKWVFFMPVFRNDLGRDEGMI